MDVASKIILAYRLPQSDNFLKLAENVSTDKFYYYYKLYFFFKSELALEKSDKASMRHLTLYRNGFYDYIARKEYKSLSQWAADNGKTLDDIVYGMNRTVIDNNYTQFEKRSERIHLTAYIPLMKLLQYLDPSYTGEPVVAVPAVKKGISVFEFDTLLTQLDAIRSTVDSMKMRLD